MALRGRAEACAEPFGKPSIATADIIPTSRVTAWEQDYWLPTSASRRSR